MKQFCINGHDTFITGRYSGSGCIECKKETNKNYYINNNETVKTYRIVNKDMIQKQQKEYYSNNKEAKFKRNNQYQIDRRKIDINFKLACSLRSRLSASIRNNQKTGSAVKDLGYSISEFKQYIESKFYSNMSWNNWGSVWELDHITPLHKFDLTDPVQLKRAVHYTNLQPLTIEDHRNKTFKDNLL